MIRWLKSGIIICMVGSISHAVLRMANGEKKIFNGPFEIVSAEGTCASNGVHIHIAIADEEGAVYGGHLLEGCNVHTTAEIGIIESKIIYKRIHDPKTVIENFVWKMNINLGILSEHLIKL